MDLFNVTKANADLIEYSSAAYSHATNLLNEGENGDCHSETSCSQSSCSETNHNNQRNTAANTRQPSASSAPSQLPLSSNHQNYEGQIKKEKVLKVPKDYIPPLPSFKILNTENIPINIPKPELRVGGTSINREQRITNVLPAPPLPDLRHLQISSPPLQINSTRLRNMTDDQQPNYSILWQEVPDQTLGIPTLLNAPTNPYMPSTSHNILPRASATNQNLNPQQNYLHFAMTAPVTTISEYPIPSLQRAPAYQPKFYEHPLVSGTIPPSTVVTIQNEDPIKRPPKKPSASILSNGPGSTFLNGITLNHHVINIDATPKEASTMPSTKRDSGEKNKVKFSDTVQVAVVPVS